MLISSGLSRVTPPDEVIVLQQYSVLMLNVLYPLLFLSAAKSRIPRILDPTTCPKSFYTTVSKEVIDESYTLYIYTYVY